MRVLAWPIDTGLNPYTSLLYANLGPNVTVDAWPGNAFRKYSVWHMHWPEAFLNIRNPLHAAFKVSGMLAHTDYLRLRGAKFVWTMHNFHSHEALHPSLERWFWRRLIPRLDGVISLSNSGLSLAIQQFPRLQDVATTVIPHGHYRGDYPQTTPDARRVLGIPERARVIMFFGAVRAYKNVTGLVQAFRRLNAPDAILYIVGQPNSATLAREIQEEASQCSRIRIKFEFVEPKHAATYLDAANLIVLPYRDVLNSGSALLSLSCSRPILVPNLGSMSELQKDFGENWVRTFAGPLNENIIEHGLEWAARPRPSVCPMPEKYEWKSIGEQTVRFYGNVVDGAERNVQVEVI